MIDNTYKFLYFPIFFAYAFICVYIYFEFELCLQSKYVFILQFFMVLKLKLSHFKQDMTEVLLNPFIACSQLICIQIYFGLFP